MCKFCCEKRDCFEIQHWSTISDLKKAIILVHPSKKKPCLKIMSERKTRGSIFINYCPMCGRKLVENG